MRVGGYVHAFACMERKMYAIKMKLKVLARSETGR